MQGELNREHIQPCGHMHRCRYPNALILGSVAAPHRCMPGREAITLSRQTAAR